MKPDVAEKVSSMTVQQIRTFCVVFERGGYAQASDELNQTTTTLWEQIKVLQRLYGAKLFQRKGRQIEPTNAGELLYAQLVPVLESIDSSYRTLAESTGSAAAEVRIVTGMRLIFEDLGEPLQRLQKMFPACSIKLMTADNLAAQQQVSIGQADIALLIEPPRESLLDNLTVDRLYAIQYLAVFPSRHRLAKLPRLSVVDLLNEPLILGNKNTVGRQLFEQAVFRLGHEVNLKPAVETDNSAATVACVRAGLGVGIIAGRSDGNLMQRLASRSLTPELGLVHVVAATRKGWKPTREISELLRHIRSTLDLE